jgi:hypothetical protein
MPSFAAMGSTASLLCHNATMHARHRGLLAAAAIIGVACMAVGIVVGLQTIQPAVRASSLYCGFPEGSGCKRMPSQQDPSASVHLSSAEMCGSVFRPHDPGLFIWNGPHPVTHIEHCSKARQNPIVVTASLMSAGAAALLVAVIGESLHIRRRRRAR